MEKYSQVYDIKNYNVDFNGNLKLTSLFDFCQDMAEAHASKHNFGYEFCKMHEIAWVLINFHIKIHKTPEWNQKLKSTTWPSKVKKLACRRDFSFEVNDEKYITAATQWINMDLNTYRPIPLSKHLPSLLALEEYSLETEFSKIQLPLEEKFIFQKSFEVFTSHIDVNQHVNNAVYPLWAVEALGFDWQKEKELKEIEISFKNQTFINDIVHVSAYFADDYVIQSIYKDDKSSENGTCELARIKTYWKNI